MSKPVSNRAEAEIPIAVSKLTLYQLPAKCYDFWLDQFYLKPKPVPSNATEPSALVHGIGQL